ncbi:MAG: hypothetical protein ACOYMW_00345 [Candidatus Competibacteraceae bacterium]
MKFWPITFRLPLDFGQGQDYLVTNDVGVLPDGFPPQVNDALLA